MGDTEVQLVDVRRCHADYIKRQIAHQTKLGIDDPLLVHDIDEVVERYKLWYKLLPRVELFYALKCNNDEKILEVLVRLGSNFDCASQADIQQVMELGVNPSRIIYANPCKQNSHLIYAKEQGVDLLTFDSEEELTKIKMLYGSARLLIRFRPTHLYGVMYDLGKKFGCDCKEAADILISAKNKGLNIIGVCFHVGSNCHSSEAFASAIKEARMIFNMGLKVGFDMTVLDIGGGYKGRDGDHPTIEENAAVINQCLDEYFPETEGVKIVAEPGRYLVESAVSAAANIIGRKLVFDNDKTSVEQVLYNINDGAYGTFTWVKEDGGEVFVLSPVHSEEGTMKHKSTMWGPTCCGTDCVATDEPLPLMEVGEWVHISYAGAYSLSCKTRFNSMPCPKLYYFCSRGIWFSPLGKQDCVLLDLSWYCDLLSYHNEDKVYCTFDSISLHYKCRDCKLN